MSVQDETFDRPYCPACKTVIPYGQMERHRGGACVLKPIDDLHAQKRRKMATPFIVTKAPRQMARLDCVGVNGCKATVEQWGPPPSIGRAQNGL